MDLAQFARIALLTSIATFAPACFDDPQANETSTSSNTNSSSSETGDDGACPDGSAGCACYGNGTCDAGLECVDELCKLPECVAGSLNCDCYNGECFTGLECVDGTCKPEQAMPGCEASANCDDNLCTQGDELCAGMCIAGVEVQCPLDASCDPNSGSCACDPGTKLCGNACIPDSQCCTDADCGGASTCQEGFCTCDGGLDCDGECIIDAVCCPGEMKTMGCTCGAAKTCTPEGTWGSCMGGNQNPECSAGQSEGCGNCGTRICSAQCTWSACGNQGPCSPGSQNCTNEGKLEMCTQGCNWMQIGTC